MSLGTVVGRGHLAGLIDLQHVAGSRSKVCCAQRIARVSCSASLYNFKD